MADILAHVIKECIECGDDYYQDESDSWSPAMYCCGECEVLAEETHNLSEDEYNELDDLYFYYYSNNFIPSPADLGRMIVLENKASEEEVRGLLENYGTSPDQEFC